MNEPSRRRFLASTTAVSTGLVLSGTESVTGADYELITVEAGETFSTEVGSGETWENKLIDITADGAGYQITASGDDWEIRNIGVRGQWDHDPGSQVIVVEVDSEGATGLIENLYLGDGTTSGAGDPGGMYVHNDHRGTITIRSCNIQGFPDNGIYASGPGLDDRGNGGVVQIEDTYASDCGTSGLRIGSDGSYVDNCVVRNSDRGLWCLFSDQLEARGCDFGGNTHDIRVGSGSQEEGGPYGELTVTDTRWDTQQLERSENSIHGSSAGAPQRTKPEEVEGVPLTADEAASGGNRSGGDDNSESGSDSNENSGSESDYNGEIHPGTNLSENENALVFSGTHITEEEMQQSEYSLAVSESLVPSRRSNATVDDNLEFSEGNTSYEGTVTDWKDAWVYTGEITELTIDGPAKVFLNGSEVDPRDYGSTGGGSDDSGDGNSSAPPEDAESDDTDTPLDGDQRPEFDDEWVENFIDSLFGDGGLFDVLFDDTGIFD